MVKYMTSLMGGSGIGSVVVGIVGSLFYMKENKINETLFINYYHASTPVKVFITNFLDISTIESNNDIKFVNINYPYNAIYNVNQEYKELFYTNDTQMIYHHLQNNAIDFSVFGKLFSKFWILKNQQELNLLKKYDICVNIRRGDKVTLESHIKVVSVKEYTDQIKKINMNDPKIFHTSDDYDTLLEMKQYLNFDIDTFCHPTEKGYFLRELNSQSIQTNINHVSKFMKELQIMKTSEYFIGSISTSVGFLAQLLRNERNNDKNIYY